MYLCYAREIGWVSEREAIEGCRRGDADARAELYRLFGGLMYALCRRYVADAQTARDLLHDGFVTVFTKIGDYRGEGSFEGWCRRVFVTTALGYLRREKRMNHPVDVTAAAGLSSGEASALENISASDLMESIAELPDGYRAILNLYAVEGYSHREVAEMMNISENTSRSQFSRAKARLGEILRQKGILT